MRRHQTFPLTSALWDSGEWPVSANAAQPVTVGVLAGEGIGPEVTKAAVDVLRAVGRQSLRPFDVRYGGVIGAASERAYGAALSPEVIDFCESIFCDGGAILCGPGESRFVYDLRARFDLFCKLTPIRPFVALSDASVLRPEVSRNVDMIIVRENAGGLYFGDWHRQAESTPDDTAHQAFGYCRRDVQRIVDVAVKLAGRRRGRLTLVIKKGAMPTVSELWIDTFQERVDGQHLHAQVMEVDNAAYQLVAKCQQFDVVVAPNLFGDILSDLAALLLGSRGLSFSGNFGRPHRAVYQTGHGAAHDIAGTSTANPIGQILSAALMLRESFAMLTAADAIWTATQQILSTGIRTADVATPRSTVVGTDEMGHRISHAVADLLASRSVPS